MFKTTSEIKEFVLSKLNEMSGINWDAADAYDIDKLESMLAAANKSVASHERGYNILTELQDETLIAPVDAIMFRLADAYAAVNTFETILSVKRLGV